MICGGCAALFGTAWGIDDHVRTFGRPGPTQLRPRCKGTSSLNQQKNVSQFLAVCFENGADTKIRSSGLVEKE